MKKNQSKKFLSTSIIIAVVLVVALFFVFSAHHNTKVPTPTNTQANARPSGPGPQPIQFTPGTLFSASPNAQYAYLISTPTLNATQKTALDGFKLTTKQNSDGTTTYTLDALKQGYTSQSYTLKNGDKLYFIERTLRDDNSTSDTDYFLGDDSAVVVNSTGYIVN